MRLEPCVFNTFSGVHVWQDTSAGLRCRACHALQSTLRAAAGAELAYQAAPVDWVAAAQVELARLIESGSEFTSEDITDVAGMPRGKVLSNANNSVGALFLRASREGLIEKAGRRVASRNPRSNGAKLEVWRAVRVPISIVRRA